MKKRNFITRISIAASLSIAAALFSVFVFTNDVKASVKTITEAIDNIVSTKNYIVKFKIRSRPTENFAYINAKDHFVDGLFETSFVAPYQWKIEKSCGRCAIFNGEKIYLWNNNMLPGYMLGSDTQYGVLEGFSKLLELRQMLNNELLALSNGQFNATITRSDELVTLVIEAKAAGDFTNDYALNSSVTESNSRRTYTFNKSTKLLTSFIIDILHEGSYVTVLKSEEIAYDQSIDWDTQMLKPDIEWRDMAAPITSSTLSGITARQAVALMLQALETSNIEPVKDAFRAYDTKLLKDELFGLKIIVIGEPFTSGEYPGKFVPCRVKLANGKIIEPILAVRDDNKNNVWILDGGI